MNCCGRGGCDSRQYPAAGYPGPGKPSPGSTEQGPRKNADRLTDIGPVTGACCRIAQE